MMWVVAIALMMPLVVFLLLQVWKRPERQFTLYSSAGRWADALPFARVLAGRPASAETRGRRQMNLGTILARVERWDEARVELEKAVVMQDAAKDSYASLSRHTLALLELRRGEVARARKLAKAIEQGSEELRPKARMIEAAALLVEAKTDAVIAMLGPSRGALLASKKPSDLVLLAILAAAEPESAGQLRVIVRERMADAQRKELAAQLPVLARVL